LLEARIAQLERELAALAKLSPVCITLLSIPGISLLTATALVAATSGDVSHFKDARHFSSWFGLTPKECEECGNISYQDFVKIYPFQILLLLSDMKI
jgi:transposase